MKLTAASVGRACVGMLLLLATGCLAQPQAAVPRALYLDLRKIIETQEDTGWVHDPTRLRASLEPALASTCQVEAAERKALDTWLATQLQLLPSPEDSFRAQHSLSNSYDALHLQRTRQLLQFAESHADECPFWLGPRANFEGRQFDTEHFFVLAETPAFVSLVLASWIPALGGGGRLLVGHGLGPQLGAALGVEVAASGTLVPNDGQGLDATATIALPVLLRVTRLSRMLDVELAPVVRWATGHNSWPPGIRLAVGAGIAGLRGAAFMSYSQLYIAYDVHAASGTTRADHTIQIGTRIGMDWAP